LKSWGWKLSIFDVRDMPVTVAVDSCGESVHQTGPKLWKSKIAQIPVVSA